MAVFLQRAAPEARRPGGVRAPRCGVLGERRLGSGAFAAARSSPPALKGITTPVFMMQGRRDFAFGIEQALRPTARSPGRSGCGSACTGMRRRSFPAADTPAMLAEGARWFDRFLRGDTAAPLANAGRRRAGELERQRRLASRARRRPSREQSSRPRRDGGLRPERPQPVIASAGRAERRRCSARRSSTSRRTRRAAGRGSSQCSAHAPRPARRSSSPAAACRRGRASGRTAIYLSRPGDVHPAGLEAHAHDRLVVARAEPRQPAVSRPPARRRRKADRHATREIRAPELATPISR